VIESDFQHRFFYVHDQLELCSGFFLYGQITRTMNKCEGSLGMVSF